MDAGSAGADRRFPGGEDPRRGVAAEAPPGAASGNTQNLPPPPPGSAYDPRLIRAERYMLLATARGLLYTEGVRQKLAYPNKIHATCKCRYITLGAGHVRVLQERESGTAFYGDLVTCGSVWTCNVCSVKIQERRRAELEMAIEWAYANGLQPVMVTLTFPHTGWQTIHELLDGQASALASLRKGSPWDRFKERVDYQGLIRGLEVKFGHHGWHPHTHELWFVSRDAIADLSTVEAREREAKKRSCKVEDLEGLVDMKSVILDRWERACRKAGLLDDSKLAAFRKHAVDVKGWCSASDYLAKQDDATNWGIDRELAKSNNKTDKDGKRGIHPFGLLAMAAEGDELAGYRFVEYSLAIRGKAQLFWSRGLKARVGVTEKSDEELAVESQEKASCLGLLETADWRAVRAVPGAMAKVLDLAEAEGWPGVRGYVDGLKKTADRNARAYSELRAEAKEREKPGKPVPARLRRGRSSPLLVDDLKPLKPIDLDDSNLELPF